MMEPFSHPAFPDALRYAKLRAARDKIEMVLIYDSRADSIVTTSRAKADAYIEDHSVFASEILSTNDSDIDPAAGAKQAG